MTQRFFIEPWLVEVAPDLVRLREPTSVREKLLGGAIALTLSLTMAAIDWQLWRREAIGGFAALLLAFGSALLLAKAWEGFCRARRIARTGPRELTFYRHDRSVERAGLDGSGKSPVDRIVVNVTTHQHLRASGQGYEPRNEYTVLLCLDHEDLELGKYGAESSAERLATTIADVLGTRVQRQSDTPRQ